MDRILKIYSTILIILLINYHLTAQRSGDHKGFYGSMNIGPGIVTGNISNEKISTAAHLAMHLNIGYFFSSSVQGGITVNGWLFEPFGEIPSGFKGESISNGMIHLQFYPFRDYRLFLKGAYGLSEYTNLRPNKVNGSGSAFMTALGYEIEIGRRDFLAGVQLSYNMGHLTYAYIPGTSYLRDRKYQAVDLTIYLALD